MLNATMKPLLSNKSYIHIRKPGFPVKMRDLFYYFLTILKAHSSFRFPPVPKFRGILFSRCFYRKTGNAQIPLSSKYIKD